MAYWDRGLAIDLNMIPILLSFLEGVSFKSIIVHAACLINCNMKIYSVQQNLTLL